MKRDSLGEPYSAALLKILEGMEKDNRLLILDGSDELLSLCDLINIKHQERMLAMQLRSVAEDKLKA